MVFNETIDAVLKATLILYYFYLTIWFWNRHGTKEFAVCNEDGCPIPLYPNYGYTTLLPFNKKLLLVFRSCDQRMCLILAS